MYRKRQNTFDSYKNVPSRWSSRDRKFNQMPREAGPWASPVQSQGPTPPGSLPEGESEAMSNAQRSTLKWEKEETLGELATVAPVLYTNVNFPNLKEEFPGQSSNRKGMCVYQICPICLLCPLCVCASFGIGLCILCCAHFSQFDLEVILKRPFSSWHDDYFLFQQTGRQESSK